MGWGWIAVDVTGIVVCVTFAIVRGVRAHKEGEEKKAALWFLSIPVFAVVGDFLGIVVALAAIVLIVITVLGALSGSVDHGMIRRSMDREKSLSEFRDELKKAPPGTTSIPVKSAWNGRGGWFARQAERGKMDQGIRDVADQEGFKVKKIDHQAGELGTEAHGMLISQVALPPRMGFLTEPEKR